MQQSDSYPPVLTEVKNISSQHSDLNVHETAIGGELTKPGSSHIEFNTDLAYQIAREPLS